jgi:hypothetical protein
MQTCKPLLAAPNIPRNFAGNEVRYGKATDSFQVLDRVSRPAKLADRSRIFCANFVFISRIMGARDSCESVGFQRSDGPNFWAEGG